MRAILVLALVIAACSRSPAPPAPGTHEGAKGLPPLEPGAELPAGHPAVPRPSASGAALEGTIEVAPALAAQVKAGDIIFLSARAVDASGAVQRMPLAVDRLSVGALPMTFRLTAENAMVPGAVFAGSVQITARVDRDGEAMTRTAGDIEGVVKAEIPARGLKIVLDTPVSP
jgi:cytochrome c-type biogenesis protein CcmH